VVGELRSALHPGPAHAPGRVVVIASPYLFSNPYARAGNPASQEESGDSALLMQGWGYAAKWMWPDVFAAYMLQWAADPMWACPEHWHALAAANAPR
jgi:hypothetical protein